jgi:hypothetical protein
MHHSGFRLRKSFSVRKAPKRDEKDPKRVPHGQKSMKTSPNVLYKESMHI